MKNPVIEQEAQAVLRRQIKRQTDDILAALSEETRNEIKTLELYLYVLKRIQGDNGQD